MKYSLTSAGIVIAVAGTLLMKYGFSESCSNEIITNIPLIVGGIVAQIGRWRAGGITLAGFHKV
jgi:hypothetical protein